MTGGVLSDAPQPAPGVLRFVQLPTEAPCDVVLDEGPPLRSC